MRKSAVFFLSFVLSNCVGHAQEINNNFGPSDFEKFVKDDLKKGFNKIENKDDKNKLYDIEGTPYYAVINTEKKFVLIYAIYSGIPADQLNAQLNAWNQIAFYSRVWSFKPEGQAPKVRFEGTIDFSAGITTPQLKSWYNLLDQERRDFDEKFKIKRQGAASPEGNGTPGPSERVRQVFPALRMGEKVAPHDETAWDIEWDIAPVGRAASLRIVSAKFSWKDANGQPRSIVVVKNLQLVEAFSQYDDGETTFLDIDAVGLKQIPASEDFLGPACVGQGEVLKSKHLPHDKKVHKELHYDGLRWMSVYGGHRGKRGEKLILWSAVASANYVYLMEYNFTDDGRIVCRLGFTAHNYFNRSKDVGPKNRTDNKDVHAHVGCWRWDFDLSDPVRNMGGAELNDIKIVRRVNDMAANRFRIDVIPFPGTNNGEATEGKAKWIAKDFTTLRAVSSVLKNTRGEPISYDLISTRNGACDGLRPVLQAAKSDMDFANYDFHVTLRPTQSVAFHKVPELSARSQPLKGKATTIWYSVPGLHVPRDEDFGNGGQNAARGAAMTEWVSFTLRPRDLFDSTPGYRAE